MTAPTGGHRHPEWWVRVLDRLGQDRSLRDGEVVSVPGEALLGPHLRQRSHVFVPSGLGRVGVHLKSTELGPGRRPRRAEFEPAPRQDVEKGGALGHADWMIDLGYADHGGMSHANLLGLHRGGGEEEFWRRGVGVLFQEVVLDGPRGVESKLVGQPNLFEGVQDDLLFDAVGEGAGNRELEDHAKLHGGTSGR